MGRERTRAAESNQPAASVTHLHYTFGYLSSFSWRIPFYGSENSVGLAWAKGKLVQPATSSEPDSKAGRTLRLRPRPLSPAPTAPLGAEERPAPPLPNHPEVTSCRTGQVFRCSSPSRALPPQSLPSLLPPLLLRLGILRPRERRRRWSKRSVAARRAV